MLEVCDTEQEEGEVEGEEEEEEGHRRLERADEQDGREDEPAHEVEAEEILEFSGAASRDGCFLDRKAAGGQDDGCANPKATV